MFKMFKMFENRGHKSEGHQSGAQVGGTSRGHKSEAQVRGTSRGPRCRGHKSGVQVGGTSREYKPGAQRSTSREHKPGAQAGSPPSLQNRPPGEAASAGAASSLGPRPPDKPRNEKSIILRGKRYFTQKKVEYCVASGILLFFRFGACRAGGARGRKLRRPKLPPRAAGSGGTGDFRPPFLAAEAALRAQACARRGLDNTGFVCPTSTESRCSRFQL